MYLFIYFFTEGGAVEVIDFALGSPFILLKCESVYFDKIYTFTLDRRRE